MVKELSPLHDHHGELVGVAPVLPVDKPADNPGVGQRAVGHGPSELLDAVAEIEQKQESQHHK